MRIGIVGSVIHIDNIEPNGLCHISDISHLIGTGVISHVDLLTQVRIRLSVALIDSYGTKTHVLCTNNYLSATHVRYIEPNDTCVADYITSLLHGTTDHINVPTRIGRLISYVTTSTQTLDPRNFGDSMSTPVDWNAPNPRQKIIDDIHNGLLESVEVAGSIYKIAKVSTFSRSDIIHTVGYGNEGMYLVVLSDLGNGQCVCVDQEHTGIFMDNHWIGMGIRIYYIYEYVNQREPVPYDISDMSSEWIGKVVAMKSDITVKHMITGITSSKIVVGCDSYDMDVAFNEFTWADGSHFGKAMDNNSTRST